MATMNGTTDVRQEITAKPASSAGGQATAGSRATAGSQATARRTELAAFLRTRRERIAPEDVGLPPGTRRRTAGLRREELAQLAGVGVTWYTWLEQGRKINASVQVLDAVARTLRLDATERAHLFRLADLPGAAATPASCGDCPLPPEVQQILDAIPLPASVLTERFDLIAWNAIYASLFPGLTGAPPDERNTILAILTSPTCCTPMQDPDDHCIALTAQLRASYGRHVGDPAWTHFIRRLEALSPTFAATWAAHDVAQPTNSTKHFRHATLGPINVTSTGFAVAAVPGARMVIYTPDDEQSRNAIARLAAGDQLTARFPCWPKHNHREERTVAAAIAP